jgi:hypothetical protein
MKYELVEKSTGARMAWTPSGQLMSTTLFDSPDAAMAWQREKGISEKTHEVREAR